MKMSFVRCKDTSRYIMVDMICKIEMNQSPLHHLHWLRQTFFLNSCLIYVDERHKMSQCACGI